MSHIGFKVLRQSVPTGIRILTSFVFKCTCWYNIRDECYIIIVAIVHDYSKNISFPVPNVQLCVIHIWLSNIRKKFIEKALSSRKI